MTYPMVYLDHNATAPMRPEAAEAVARACSLVGNASSVHRFGRAARRVVEDAREAVAGLLGAAPENVIFTSGGTEANHLALRGCGRSRVLASAVEHSSVLKARDGIEVIPVDGNGAVDLNALEAMLAGSDVPALVSLMFANNETGVLQPVPEAAEIARRYGALLHCDAVQAVGKVSVDASALGAHILTVSAHKLGGPPGVGALVLAPGTPLTAIQAGGGQERGLRAGTENLPGIAGFGAAVEALSAGGGSEADLAALRDRLEARVREIAPSVRVIGEGAARLANTSCLATPGLAGAAQVMALDLAGIAVSAGAACSSGKVTPSPVLRAMGLDEEEAAEAIRVSFGWNSRTDDVDRFVAAWSDIWKRHASATARSAA